MTIPISDQVFSMRTVDMVAVASSVMGKKVVERLKLIDEYAKMGIMV